MKDTVNYKVKFKKQRIPIKDCMRRDWQFWLLCLPSIVILFIFCYVPMYGVSFAFFDYSISSGLVGSEFVGWRWFEKFFSSYYFWRILKNTILLNLLNIIFTFPCPIVLALMLNSVRNKPYKKVVQTISYLPHFISTVIVVGMMRNLLSPTSGIVNNLLIRLGIVDKSINFFYEANWFRPLYIISEIWQHIGWNSIIYLSALSAIDTQLYDAAKIDGANYFQELFNVTLPGISSTIITLFVLSFGQIMNVGFEKVLLMYNPSTYSTSDVIATFTYREGILGSQLGYGTAVGLFNSLINIILIVIFNGISRKVSEISLW